MWYELSDQVQYLFLKYNTSYLFESFLLDNKFLFPLNGKWLAAAASFQSTFCICFSFSLLRSGFSVDLYMALG